MNAREEPADTRMMGIVHDALKRDLLRARHVLSTSPAPQGRQRVALGTHVTWMLDFLHAHHSAEDAGLWPLVRRRNPSAAELLDSMEADHARIAPAADATAAAAHEYTATAGDSARAQLVEALDGLLEVLVPHLDREVAEAMPVVAASITDREWDAVEKRYNIEPKTTRQLAMEGHWLLEGIDDEGYHVVVRKVPAVLRFLLLHGYGRAYRRQAEARWTPDACGSTPNGTGVRRRFTRTGNRIAVWLYRRLDGRLSSGRKDVHVLMITAPGRRTGTPRSTCVRFLHTADGPVVWGTGSGSPRDPDWFRNLRAATVVEVQVGRDRFQARPRELTGHARDMAWAHTILAQAPEVARYARKAGRTIPVAILQPVDRPGD